MGRPATRPRPAAGGDHPEGREIHHRRHCRGRPRSAVCSMPPASPCRPICTSARLDLVTHRSNGCSANPESQCRNLFRRRHYSRGTWSRVRLRPHAAVGEAKSNYSSHQTQQGGLKWDHLLILWRTPHRKRYSGDASQDLRDWPPINTSDIWFEPYSPIIGSFRSRLGREHTKYFGHNRLVQLPRFVGARSGTQVRHDKGHKRAEARRNAFEHG
jgi:hypothetical protein